MLQRKSSFAQKLAADCRIRYLPFEVKGNTVIVDLGGNSFRIDNSLLKDRAHGLCYRLSKNIRDKDYEHIAFWNTVVTGEQTDDGWLCCDIDEECLDYLDKLDKEGPLQSLKQSEACKGKRAMLAESTSSNMDGRWTSRAHAGAKLIDGEKVQYGQGLTTTLSWEGLNTFSIDIMGERRKARLVDDSIVWSDGDIWTRDQRDSEVRKPTDLYGDDLSSVDAPYCVVCQKGLKPGSPNQDAWSVLRVEHEFSIYTVSDGHGPHGHDVANFVKETLPRMLVADPRMSSPGMKGLFVEEFRRLHMLIDSADAYSKMNARWSGTTATTCFHNHRTGSLLLGHVGDSSVVIGRLEGKELKATQLTRDHKPQLLDERSRIEAAGGTIDFDGHSDYRIYNKDGYGAGLNMTRSLGDLEAHRESGLIADPEVLEYQVGPSDQFLVMCSDGIWEFMTPQEVVDIVAKHTQGTDSAAADALVQESRIRWVQQAEYIDDIVALVVYLNPRDRCRSAAIASGGA
eukprot:CAMPEP_0181432056 /NCGR_PEP_ID=MMETSP1110-20121109/18570_1 /TAXON_ID=174948 /ORGANISM="Symbiodinium sp., Strain CCMP421" /LENGTH=511 /DNA_ID=CAMNT_0023555447 /DNA_START=102 /DNA_END=1637 /DNA_ORIENTATION=-